MTPGMPPLHIHFHFHSKKCNGRCLYRQIPVARNGRAPGWNGSVRWKRNSEKKDRLAIDSRSEYVIIIDRAT